MAPNGNRRGQIEKIKRGPSNYQHQEVFLMHGELSVHVFFQAEPYTGVDIDVVDDHQWIQRVDCIHHAQN